jgi:preprotein translocase subunit YajC
MAAIGMLLLVFAIYWITMDIPHKYDDRQTRKHKEQLSNLKNGVHGIIKEKITGKKDDDNDTV